MEFDSVGQSVRRWNAWVVEQAMPLDQFLGNPSTSDEVANGCAIGTIRSMLHAAKHGHTMSDNAMFDFGLLGNEIVIIDAGARHLTPEMSKRDFNVTTMRKLWGKLRIHGNVTDLAVYQAAWQKAGDMVRARATFDALWAASHGLVVDNTGSAEQPAPQAVATCVPHVATLLDDISDESLNWLLTEFLWGTVSQYALVNEPQYFGQALTIRTVRYHEDHHCSAEVKLDMAIALTRERRERFCSHPQHRHPDRSSARHASVCLEGRLQQLDASGNP